MVRLKFCKKFRLVNLEVIELPNAEAFLKFYLEHCDKGLIYGVEEIN